MDKGLSSINQGLASQFGSMACYLCLSMKKIFALWANHFWVRNLSVLAGLIVLEQSVRPFTGWMDAVLYAGITIALYAWLLFHNRILLERCLFKKKYLIYVVGTTVGMVYYSLVMYSNSLDRNGSEIWSKGLFIAFFNTLMGTLFYLAFKYYREQQDFARNKIYLFEMEQQYLRNQLSPHFLFNTLNNIYSYSLTDNQKTPELILKMSELMRYLIQFNKHNQISLKEELTFIENYLAFERERLSDRCTVVFDKTIEEDERPIEPLLFFPLIENAFKHGTDTLEDCFVKLNIVQSGQTLRVQISNRILACNKPSTHSGIENVDKRLRLFYPGRYTLSIQKENGVFMVDLSLKLNPWGPSNA